jgi:ankyrin repeat protein
LVEAAAQAGIPIDVVHEPRLEATADDPLRQTALATLAHSTVCENGEGARVEAIERLLSKGASPNSQNSLGQTPLYGVQSIGVANVLLKHGADASITDKTGQSMVFGTTNDAVVYRLLSAGASPVGTYPDGRSLFDLAKSGKMPQTSKWLSKHGPR